MNIEDQLRQLNKIQPDPAYVRDSRARLLMASRAQFPKVTFAGLLAGMLRSGSAMAVTGLLLLFAVGGFSIWNTIGPLTGWDSKTLLAEAQAIDIQIHLAELQYKDSGSGRERLISPRADVNSIALAPDAVEPDEAPSDEDAATAAITSSEEGDEAAGDEDSDSEDSENASSTPADPGDEDGDTSTSTAPTATPEPVTVEDALQILSR
jgi:hypothetical protein